MPLLRRDPLECLAEGDAELAILGALWSEPGSGTMCAHGKPSSCDWYHGAWPYLRLLDLVSTPAWHGSFFRKGIAEQSTHRPDLRILISGCADHSMYALAHSQLAESGRITALDLCPTPLLATSRYARHIGAPVPELLVTDAIAHERPGTYDIIVSDSFLPRFFGNELSNLLLAWNRGLSPTGTVLTTVRLHQADTTSPSQNVGRLHRWLQVADDARSWWSELSRLPYEELIRRISDFVANQERKTLLDISTLHALFLEAGFEQPTVTTRQYRDREFALIEARKPAT